MKKASANSAPKSSAAKSPAAKASTAKSSTAKAAQSPSSKKAGTAKHDGTKNPKSPAATKPSPTPNVANPSDKAAKTREKPAKAAAKPTSTPPPSAAVSPPRAPEKAGAKASDKTAAKPADSAGGATKTTPVRGTPGQIVPTPSRTPARSPVGAEELKMKLGALSTATAQIRALKRTLGKSFFEIGRILSEVQEKRLFEVKGYGSFESFAERELPELGKTLSIRLARISQSFVRDAAVTAGLDRTTAALAALDGESDMMSTSTSVPAPGASAATRSSLPPHKV